MNQDHDMKSRRSTGIETINARAISLALASGTVIEKCVWDIGEDFTHEHAHRLDLFTDAKTVRLYFTDLELTRSEEEMRKKRTEVRLNNAIPQLRNDVPAATYSFR